MAIMEDKLVLEMAENGPDGSLFRALYNNGDDCGSDTPDLDLCSILAYWTARDAEQIDRLFRGSALVTDAWDKTGKNIVAEACAMCEEVYDGRMKFKQDPGHGIPVAKFPSGKSYEQSDTGNAARLRDAYGHMIRYSYTRKGWFVWTGARWEYDESGYVKRMADAVIEAMKSEADHMTDDKSRASLLKWAQRTSSSSNKEDMVKECRHLEGIPVSMDELDAAGMVINCPNGVVDLKTGELLEHDPSMMLTKMTGAEHDKSHGRPERWLQFLDEVTGGDKDLQEYIQRSVGYSLSGTGREQCAYFLYGLGNNGKSTFLDTIADILGSYAANAQPDTLMLHGRGSSGSSANSDIARLNSARFVTCEEPTEGVRLNEGLMKQLTGGGRVTARYQYGNEFEFRPEFAAWIATNHKPVIRGTDLGIWRRVKLVPFEQSIPDSKVDKELKEKLRKEWPQILAWAVEGCIKWQKDGLKEPAAVTQATKEYKQEMDLVACFVDQCLVIDYAASERIMAADMFAMYSKWADTNNEYKMSAKKFGIELSKKVPEHGRCGKGNYYAKITVTEYGRQFMARLHTADKFT